MHGNYSYDDILLLTLDTDQNWIEGVRQVHSPNCDDRPDSTDISLIVIHGISLPPGQYGECYIDDLFCNCLDSTVHDYFKEIEHLRVSSHVMINRQGEITQYVPFTQRAWHAGVSNFQGREQCNDFSIGIELEGCDEEDYELAQYQTAAELITALRRNWPGLDDEHIVGHSDIAPGRKTDPGPAFKWQQLYKMLNNA